VGFDVRDIGVAFRDWGTIAAFATVVAWGLHYLGGSDVFVGTLNLGLIWPAAQDPFPVRPQLTVGDQVVLQLVDGWQMCGGPGGKATHDTDRCRAGRDSVSSGRDRTSSDYGGHRIRRCRSYLDNRAEDPSHDRRRPGLGTPD
jgi:hypothetical protein